jgi:hypothetical protein
METRIQSDKTGISDHGMKHGRNWKQTRNYPILHGSRFTHQWQNAYRTIPYYWIGNQKIILGLPWLQKHNSEINWKEGTLYWRTTTMEEVLDKEHLNQPINASDKVLLEYLGMENKIWINSKDNLATRLAAEVNQKKPDLKPEQLVPLEYHEYLDIFDKDKANWFPDTRPWDHKIEIKSRFKPKLFKTYNLTPEEQVELDKFLKENLDKGYIKLSQSPMASSFFFVKSSDPAKIIDT